MIEDNKNTAILKNTVFIFKCPHCNELIEVEKSDLNCCIFRHGIYEINNTQQQISPHASKEECENLIRTGLIEGCGKPFKFIQGEINYVEKCDYI